MFLKLGQAGASGVREVTRWLGIWGGEIFMGTVYLIGLQLAANRGC